MMCAARPLFAQDPLPPIGPFVFDLHGVVPKFGDDPNLATSRGLSQTELPGMGLGLSASAHFYLPKIFGVAVGLGAEAMIARSSSSPDNSGATATTTPLRAVTETWKEFSPQISLNFGGATGWSYLSFGIGRTLWSVIPEGGTPSALDEDPIPTINYGGGGRWFIKKHLAFSLDVRVYGINANTTAAADVVTVPRTNLLVIGAGISVR
jgi:hypothetical protein